MKKSEDKKNFINIANSVGELVQEKNIAYGDSFAKSQQIVSVLYPDGVKPEQYRDMLAITRVIDKLFRIATKKDAFGESPWRDICGYAILGIANDEEEAKAKPTKTNAELWEEQQKETTTVRHTYRDLLRNPDKYMSEEEQERLRESILQGVRDKRDEGHGNPYANIDRDVRISYSNLEEAIDNVDDDEQTNAEGNKDNNVKTKTPEVRVEEVEEEEQEEWSKVVARRTNNLPGLRLKRYE